MTPSAEELAAARAQWEWRGQRRPSFAVIPEPGQVSVWDFLRPPQLASDAREVLVRWAGVEIARTRRAVRVLETGPPAQLLSTVGRCSARLPATGTRFVVLRMERTGSVLVARRRQSAPAARGLELPPAARGCRGPGRLCCLLPGRTRVHGRWRAGNASARPLLWRLDHTRTDGPVQGRSGHRSMVRCNEAVPGHNLPFAIAD